MIMRMAYFTSVALMVLCLNSSAQTNQLPFYELPYVEVNGTAELEVIPDEIYVSITLTERYLSKDNKLTIDVQENNLMRALKSVGIDLKDLFLSDINADYVKIRRKNKDVLTKKDYTLKLSKASIVGQVFQELDKIDITDAYVSRVTHSALDSLKKEVRIKAVKAAKYKADYLLNALGEQTGKVLIIRDAQDDTQPYHPMPRVMAMMAADGVPEQKEEIQFQKIKLTSNIYIKFAVK